MKLLIWKFKYDDVYFDISTKAKEDAAYRYMFEDLEEDFQAYCELTPENIAAVTEILENLRKASRRADALVAKADATFASGTPGVRFSR